MLKINVFNDTSNVIINALGKNIDVLKTLKFLAHDYYKWYSYQIGWAIE